MRYLPLTAADRAAMCETIGIKTPLEVFNGIDQAAFVQPEEQMPDTMPEWQVEQVLGAWAARNTTAISQPFFLGGGVYYHHVPASVDHLIQRGEFLTSYTPYQPEISQGTLQYLFEFQTMVASLFGLEVANASLYDGSTACVEAAMMANRLTRRQKVVVSGNLHPHYREVLETYASMIGFTLDCASMAIDGVEDLASRIDEDTSCVIVQYPDFFGHIRDYRAIRAACDAHKALLVSVTTEIISLGAIEAPGAWGADIAVAEGQSLGVGMNFGGPHLGLFACKKEHLRQMPGRVCGETVDANGKRGYVLTLSTREQHIRRDKATSNICTNSGLCALAFTIHLSLLGREGFPKLAQYNHAMASNLADSLAKIKGVRVINQAFFNEFTVQLPRSAADVVAQLQQRGILAGVPLSRFGGGMDDVLLVAATEMTTPRDCQQFVATLQEVLA